MVSNKIKMTKESGAARSITFHHISDQIFPDDSVGEGRVFSKALCKCQRVTSVSRVRTRPDL